jgi:competence protein ComEC
MKGIVLAAVLILAVANFGVWRHIFFSSFSASAPEAWFLDVGQGDSQLLLLPRTAPAALVRGLPRLGAGEPVKILIDAGPNRRAVEELDQVIGAYADKYIDVLILTHASADHYGGFNEILERYDVGAFIYNGRKSESAGFRNLMKLLEEKAVPVVELGGGSEILYAANRLSVLSPDSRLLNHRDINESSLVILYDSGGMRALFTGDIGFPAENAILAKGQDISADILKVGHHGSKFSSGEGFVRAVSPEISVISVGQNRYGHPTRRVLEVLERVGSRIYRTDLDGTVRFQLF